MKAPVILLLLAPVVLLGQTAKDTCIECHSVLDGAAQRPVILVKNDVHTAYGLSCAD